MSVCLILMVTMTLNGCGDSTGDKTVVLSFTGDVMLSRGLESVCKGSGYDYPYRKVKDIFLEDDFTLVNLEGPLTDEKMAEHHEQHVYFRAEEAHGEAMSRNGIDIANLANNHSLDCGYSGLEDTVMNLKKNGISSAGITDVTKDYEILSLSKNEMNIGILGLSTVDYHNFGVGDASIKMNMLAADVYTFIEIEKPNFDVLIVSIHWGTEYNIYPSKEQKKIAYKLIDSGVDLIIGHHPHVVQTVGNYKGKEIHYSLGNFIFDRQIPSGTDESYILQMEIGENKQITYKKFPISIENGQPQID